jgi:hypothetical protein
MNDAAGDIGATDHPVKVVIGFSRPDGLLHMFQEGSELEEAALAPGVFEAIPDINDFFFQMVSMTKKRRDADAELAMERFKGMMLGQKSQVDIEMAGVLADGAVHFKLPFSVFCLPFSEKY